MSKAVTAEDYTRLEALPEHERREVERRLAADPSDRPDLQALMREVERDVAEWRRESERTLAQQETEVPDESGCTWEICGRPARPLSVGVLRVLEAVGHPLMSGDADGIVNMTLHDSAALLYVLTCPDLRQLVRLSADPAAFAEEVGIFAFGLDVHEIETACQQAMDRMPTSDAADDDAEDGENPTGAAGSRPPSTPPSEATAD